MNPNHLRFSRAGAVLTTKVIDGKFPDYQSVVNQKLTETVIADRGELYDVLARTAVLTNEKYRGVRLEVESGNLKVTAHNPDQEEASDEISVEYAGQPIEIGFNVTYLMEALRALLGAAGGALGSLGEAFGAVFGVKMRLKINFGEKTVKIEKQRFAWEG